MPYDWTDEFQKGDKVKITDNSIMKMMGYPTVTGTIFMFYDDAFALKCTETGSMERISWEDGEIEKI